MKEWNGVYVNDCTRGGAPCLFSKQVKVSREDYWDYYDSKQKAYVFLECKLNQKYYTSSVLQIEEAEKYQSGVAASTYEHPDLQLADTNGRWMTRSDDPECYYQEPWEEAKTCSLCDIICDIRDDERYLNKDGTCPFPDPAPTPIYWRIEESDGPCKDYLHPLLLQDIEAINRRRRRTAKARIWKYLKEPRWMHALINSGQRIIDVWERNYKPAQIYFNSLDTIKLFLKTIPEERKTEQFLELIRRNVRGSPSYETIRRRCQ